MARVSAPDTVSVPGPEAEEDRPLPEDAPSAAEGIRDPYESLNRHFFKMNRRMDQNVLRPVASAYVTYVSENMRIGLHNLLQLANMPVVFANDVLQAHFDAAGETLTRTVTNVVFGLGVYDAASAFGLPDHGNDFGRTLGVWGWTEPSYLMLPLLGPTSSRDVVGFIGNTAMDPAIVLQYPYFLWVLSGRKVAGVIDRRASFLPTLDTLERQALDPYAMMRSLWIQRRETQIRDAKSNIP